MLAHLYNIKHILKKFLTNNTTISVQISTFVLQIYHFSIYLIFIEIKLKSPFALLPFSNNNCYQEIVLFEWKKKVYEKIYLHKIFMQ